MSACFCTTGNRWSLTPTNLWKEKGREFKYKSSPCAVQFAHLHINPLQLTFEPCPRRRNTYSKFICILILSRKITEEGQNSYTKTVMYFNYIEKVTIRGHQFWCSHPYQLLHSIAKGSMKQVIENICNLGYVL